MLFKEKIKQAKKVRLCSVLLMLVATILPLTTISVRAKSSSLDVTSVTILEKSSTITASEPTISDNEIQGGSLSFNEPEDYVIYELSLKNNTAEQFKITSITDNNTNNYLVFTYNYDNDFLAPGDETTATIKIAYAEELINQNLSLDNLVIKINIENENGDTDEISFIPNANTPNTGLFTKNSNISAENNITIIALVAFLAFLTGGIVLIVIKRKTKGAKVGAILLILAFAMVPFAVTAKEKYEISFEFSSIEVQGEFETYSITINPNDGSAPILRDITYGEPIGELPTPEKTGYDFDKWVDNNGNEVTADTIITGEINIQARYVAKNYSITYNLDNGTLPDGESNPENYTIESNDITLINPSKPGYTFTGWTGSNGDTPEVTVVVSNGSTENKSFVANYTANTNTPYTVIHKKQKLDLSGYDIAETEDLTGTTGATIEPAVRTYTGFISPSPQSTTINGEGTTEIVYEYSRESYTVTFNTNGGGNIEQQTIVYEGKVSKPNDPVRAGYVFDNWYTDDTYETVFDFNNTVVVGNITIYADYVAEGTMVIFDPTGGVIPTGEAWIGSGNFAKKNVEIGQAYGSLPTPAKEGYDFAGWATDQNAIPDEYQAVEYLEGTTTSGSSGQYIDTGFVPNQDTRVIADFEYTYVDNGRYFTGSEDANGYKQRYRFGTSGTNGGTWAIGYNNQIVYEGVPDTERHVLDFNKNIVSLDNNVLYEFSYGSFIGYGNIYIFAINTSGTRAQGPEKVYSYKIYDNEVLVRDYVPCYRKSDHVAGLYDKVNNVFYTNDGSGTFVVGSDVDSGMFVDSETIVENGEAHTLYAKWEVHKDYVQMSGQVFPSVRDMYSQQISTDAFKVYSTTGASYTFANFSQLSGKTITRIGIPVMKVNAIDDNQVFTIKKFKNNSSALKGSPIATYQLKLPQSELGTNADSVNKWIYVDCNIPIGNDETIAFFDANDGVLPGYIGRSQYNKYRFSWFSYYTKVGQSTFSGESSDIGIDDNANIPFDIYANWSEEVDSDPEITQLKQILYGKKISFLGDSITTFDTYNNNINANTTIADNRVFYDGSTASGKVDISNPYKTWWMKTITKLGLGLVVNNSSSGSKVFEPSGSRTDYGWGTRATNLHSNIGTDPDIIAVYLGINDVNNGNTLGEYSESLYGTIITDNGDGTYTYSTPTTFAEAYIIMMHKIITRYPNADVYCMTLPPNGRELSNESNLTKYNNIIRQVATHYGLTITDLYNDSGVTYENYSDYLHSDNLHPKETGMAAISDTFIRSLKENYLSTP